MFYSILFYYILFYFIKSCFCLSLLFLFNLVILMIWLHPYIWFWLHFCRIHWNSFFLLLESWFRCKFFWRLRLLLPLLLFLILILFFPLLLLSSSIRSEWQNRFDEFRVSTADELFGPNGAARCTILPYERLQLDLKGSLQVSPMLHDFLLSSRSEWRQTKGRKRKI